MTSRLAPYYIGPLVAALLLGGCSSLGIDYAKPSLRVAQGYDGASQTGLRIAPDSSWWRNLGDPLLDRIIADALQQNLSLAQAVERVVAARATAKSVGADALPSLSASAAATTSASSATSEVTTSYQAGFDAGWEIDLFGGKKRSRESARATLEATIEASNLSRLTLLGDVAQTYVELRGYQYRLRITRDSVQTQRELFELVEARVAAGSATALDLARSTGGLRSSEAQIPSLELQVAQSINRLATLLDVAPAELRRRLGSRDAIPAFKGNVRTGIPAELVRSRPDVRQAERTLAAETADIGVAEAALYPSLNLGGTLTLSGSETLVTGWSLAPSLSLPIFDGGAGKARVEIAESEARQAYLDYRETVVSAFEEVQNAIVSVRQQQVRRAALLQSVESYKSALAIVRTQFDTGAATLQDVLDAQASLVSARDSYAQSSISLSTAFVALCKALGGGWQVAA
jgi:multidrug efflux system outer membrane protein